MNIITGNERIDLLLAFLTAVFLVIIVVYIIVKKTEELNTKGICKHCRHRSFRYLDIEQTRGAARPRTEGVCVKRQKVTSVDGRYWRIDDFIALDFIHFALLVIAIGASLIILA